MNVSDVTGPMISVNTTRANVNNTNDSNLISQNRERADLQSGDEKQIEQQRMNERLQSDGDTRKEQERVRLAALARREEERENVVAVSEDGDTLQVENEKADILDEEVGGVVLRNRAQEADLYTNPDEAEADEEAASGVNAALQDRGLPPRPEDFETETNIRDLAAEAEAEEIESTDLEDSDVNEEDVIAEEAALLEQDSVQEEEPAVEATAEEPVKPQTSADFIGISDDRLEQMYLQGEISQYDYNNEMEAREAERENIREDNAMFSNQMNALDMAQRRVENDADSIRKATSEEANDKLSAQVRLDIIEGLSQNNTEQRREEEQASVWQSQFQA